MRLPVRRSRALLPEIARVRVKVQEPRLTVRVPAEFRIIVDIVRLGLFVAKSSVPVKLPVPIIVMPLIVLVPPMEAATVTTAAPEPPSASW